MQCTYNLSLWHFRATTVAAEKKISITYSECVFVAVGIQHAMRMRHIVICGLAGSTIIFHRISYVPRFKEIVIGHKMCFLFSLERCLKHFSLSSFRNVRMGSEKAVLASKNC